MQIVIVYITYTLHNIFLNVFFKNKEKNIPILFRTLGLEKMQGAFMEEDALKEFIWALGFWLARVSIKKLILIFKNFGISYTQLGQTNKNLDRLRILVINQLIFFKIPITQLIEHSPIAYNGCRLKKSRRKKRRYFEQNLPKLK